MMNFLLVAAGGAMGAGLRHLASGAIVHRMGNDWPFATFSINVVGSLLLGVLTGWFAFKGAEGAHNYRLLLGTGLMGGFTTFSTFSVENVLLIERGRWLDAGAYALGSVIVGLGAVFLGLWFSRKVFG